MINDMNKGNMTHTQANLKIKNNKHRHTKNILKASIHTSKGYTRYMVRA
jgi:hypothetical protein